MTAFDYCACGRVAEGRCSGCATFLCQAHIPYHQVGGAIRCQSCKSREQETVKSERARRLDELRTEYRQFADLPGGAAADANARWIMGKPEAQRIDAWHLVAAQFGGPSDSALDVAADMVRQMSPTLGTLKMFKPVKPKPWSSRTQVRWRATGESFQAGYVGVSDNEGSDAFMFFPSGGLLDIFGEGRVPWGWKLAFEQPADTPLNVAGRVPQGFGKSGLDFVRRVSRDGSNNARISHATPVQAALALLERAVQ
jgi:hypothetical protein